MKRLRSIVLVLSFFVCVPLLGHAWIEQRIRFVPRQVDRIPARVWEEGGATRSDHGYRKEVEGVTTVYLSGAPSVLGQTHVNLLRQKLVTGEAEVWRAFEREVPSRLLRTALLDVGRVRYRDVLSGFPEPRVVELSSHALGFVEDPYADKMDTFTRLVFLHSLYDMALSFESSPLLGCTTLLLGRDKTLDGHVLAARAFDFEVSDMFDRDKVVYLVEEAGRIPFASVSWPGVVGVVTGMNRSGLFLTVHGARAGDVSTSGIPVLFGLRETLSLSHNAKDAIARLANEPVMVPHMVFVADGDGDAFVVERIPQRPAHVRAIQGGSGALTNHLEGPSSADEKNLRVLENTTTRARRARADALVTAASKGDPERLLSMLRDHACQGGECPLGDRRAIDAFIATHGVVVDLTSRVLWVSRGPHLAGAFVGFDLEALFSAGPTAPPGTTHSVLSEDPLLANGAWQEGEARARGKRR